MKIAIRPDPLTDAHSTRYLAEIGVLQLGIADSAGVEQDFLRRHKRVGRCLLATAFIAVLWLFAQSPGAAAQTIIFTGPDVLWSDVNNWNPQTLPSGNNVVIDGFLTRDDASYTILSLTVLNGGIVVLDGSYKSGGLYLTHMITLTVSGAVDNSNGIQVDYLATLAFIGSASATGIGSFSTSGGNIAFSGNSTAGNSSFTNLGNSGVIGFSGNATA